MLHRNIGITFLLLFVSGCATKSHFVYDHPLKNQGQPAAKMVAAVAPVQDQRKDAKKIDKIYSSEPLNDIQLIVREELSSTGLFKDVIAISKENKEAGTNVRVETSLMKMNWEVPGYDAMVGKVFVVSLLTGGIGGLVYGSTGTDVYGDVGLHLRLVEPETGRVLFDKAYDARCEKQVVKLQCDTPETKATMVGESLKRIMEDVKTDLHQTFGTPDKVDLSSR